MRFDVANFGQANRHAFAFPKIPGIIDHEALRRYIDNVHRHITARAVFANHREIDRVPRCATLVCYRKLCSICHVFDPYLVLRQERPFCQLSSEKR